MKQLKQNHFFYLEYNKEHYAFSVYDPLLDQYFLNKADKYQFKRRTSNYKLYIIMCFLLHKQ